MNALAALKRAIVETLAADAGLASVLQGQSVYDHPPPSAAFPYLSFGRATLHDWSTATEPGTEILLTLDVWSRARGSAEAAAIAGRIEALLAEGLAPVAFVLVNLTTLSCLCSHDADAAVHHAALNLRAVLEPVA